MTTLWYYSHPSANWAKVNPAIFADAQKLLADATFVNLETEYEGKLIDSKVEEQRILAADTIVFQFPVHMLGSTPRLTELVFGVFSKYSAYAASKSTDMKQKRIILVTSKLGGVKDEPLAVSKGCEIWVGAFKQFGNNNVVQFQLGSSSKATPESIEAFVKSIVEYINQ